MVRRRLSPLLIVALLLGVPRPANAQPFGWSAQSIFLGSQIADSLVVVNLATGEREATFPAPAGVRVRPGALTPDGRFYLLPTSVGLARLHASPPAFDRMIGPPVSIDAIAVAPAGTSAHLTGAFGRGVINWESGEVDSLQCCAQPFVSFSPDGAIRVEVTPGPGSPPTTSTLSAYSGSTGTLLWAVSVPSSGSRAAVGQTAVALPVTIRGTQDVPATIVFSLATGAERGRILGVSGAMDWVDDTLLISYQRYAAVTTARLSRFDAVTLAETILIDEPAGPLNVSVLSVHASADGQYAYWLWYQSVSGLSVSSTSYRVVDVTSGAVLARGLVGSQIQNDLSVEPAPHCFFGVPPLVSGPVEGGLVPIPVQAGLGCRPWRTSQPSVINPGPHAADATLLVHLQPSVSSQPRETLLQVVGQTVHVRQDAAVPAPPTLTAVVEGARVRLAWSLAVGAGVTSFTVRGASMGSPVTAVAVLSGAERTWLSPPLPSGSYTVELMAANGAGNSTASNQVAFSIGAVGAPGTPSALSAVVTDDQVTLSWVPPLTAPAPSEFVVEAAPAGTTGFVEVIRSAAPTVYLTRVPVGTWDVRVRAVTAGGASPPTAATAVITAACSAPPGIPLAPWSIWTPATYTVQWAAPASGSVDAYVLELGTTPGGSELGQRRVPGGQRSVTEAVAGGGPYFVRVRARNACGISAASADVVLLAR